MNKLKIENYDKVLGFLPKEIRENENVIICGGFPLSIMTSQFIKKSNAEIHIDPVFYSDIDIFKIGKHNCELLKFLDEGKSDSFLSKDNYNIKYRRSSFLANTFYFRFNDGVRYEEIQFIKKEYSSILDLFNNFDLKNCQVAIAGDSFVFTDDFYNSCFVYYEVSQKKDPNPTTFPSKLFYGNRYMKYIAKQAAICRSFDGRSYSDFGDVSLCNDLYKYIKDLYLECELKTKEDISKDDQFYTNSYGRVFTTHSSMHKMFDKFIDSFQRFVKIKNFNKEDALFFLNSNHGYISSAAKIAIQ